LLTHALLPDSPAIDAGNPSAKAGVGGVPEFDERGMPFARVTNGDDVPEARVDMGAIEWQPNPLAGDYNLDGVVDAADYVLWRKLVGSAVDLRADGDGDGDVDADDRGVWAANFGNVLTPSVGTGAATASQPPVLPGVSVAMNSESDSDSIGPFTLAKPPAQPGAVGVFAESGVNWRARHDEALMAWLRADDHHSNPRTRAVLDDVMKPSMRDSAPSLHVAFEVALGQWGRDRVNSPVAL
jgi:hypothetical protein